MNLKNYQTRTLDILENFLTDAKIIGNAKSFEKNRAAQGYNPDYQPLRNLENVPYICLRLPTGGGKTLIGTHAIQLVAENFLDKDFPFVLWLVPSNEIRSQTLKVLQDANNFYSQILYRNFNGKVQIFDVTDFRRLRPQDLKERLNICVATFQSFKVEDREGRKVYQAAEELEACFTKIPRQDYFILDEKGRYKSFANLISYLQPLMIVDEAHNYSTDLSFDVTKILNPSAVIELTATPAQNSNVLVKISASELHKEEMIKLPLILGEVSNSPEKAISFAVQKRLELESLAATESEYLRPIALYQAENKNREFNVDFVKNYLIEGEKVPADEIAIATGEKHELEGVNLYSRDCKIRHIITVQALKEGWDCPFAAIFCSLSNTHSARDAEQLLGRVLRMPYATRRKSSELNQAYAFFRVSSWTEAVGKIKDDLFGMGFDNDEVNYALNTQLKLFDEQINDKITPNNEKSPAERGVKFSIPQLCLDFGNGAKVARREDFFPAKDWSLTETGDYSLPLSRIESDIKFYEINLRGNKLTDKLLLDDEKNLFGGKTNWTESSLVNWLAGKIKDTFIAPEDLLEFTRRTLNQLMNDKNFSLDELARLKFSIQKLLEEKVEMLIDTAYKQNWQVILFGNATPKVCVEKNIAFTFNPTFYPVQKLHTGSTQFTKHFYPQVGYMNSEEIFCAQCIDANPKVATWIRNIEREPTYSFWLQTHKDKFYPDFVIMLKDGTFAAVEYKGEVYKTNDDSKEKNMLGEIWAENSNGLCKFLMAVNRDDKGRDLTTQITDFLI